MQPKTLEAISILRKAKLAKEPRFSEQDLAAVFADIRSLADEELLAPPLKVTKPKQVRASGPRKARDPLLVAAERAFTPVTGSSKDKAERLLKTLSRRGLAIPSTGAKTLGQVLSALRKQLTAEEILAYVHDTVEDIVKHDDMREVVL